MRKIHNGHLPPVCGECSFFKHPDINRFGWCEIINKIRHITFGCHFTAYFPTYKETERILHHYNKWRVGCKAEKKMSHTWLIGLGLDSALKIIRKQRKEHGDQESI